MKLTQQRMDFALEAIAIAYLSKSPEDIAYAQHIINQLDSNEQHLLLTKLGGKPQWVTLSKV